MHLSHLGTSLKSRPGRNRALAFATIQQQPFRYYGISDLRNVPSEIQTNGSPTGQGKDYRIIGL
jgi:hypothetical protein